VKIGSRLLALFMDRFVETYNLKFVIIMINDKLMIMAGLGVLLFTVYLFYAIGEFIKSFMFSKSVIKRNAFAWASLAIVVLTTLALILDGLAIAFNARLFMEPSLFTLNLVIISLFFNFFKYPGYEKRIQAVVENERKKRSYLSGMNMENLEERLNYLIKQDDIISDENLGLETMALKQNVSKHQLSEFLNQHLGQNFKTFIKKHRIDMAKKLLIQHPDRKILAVAFDVGFKSKSTFNAAFLHFEQITPAEYRKKNQK
jgi:AraC-like DNA-binding protein